MTIKQNAAGTERLIAYVGPINGAEVSLKIERNDGSIQYIGLGHGVELDQKTDKFVDLGLVPFSWGFGSD